jgi:hypothetical protein
MCMSFEPNWSYNNKVRLIDIYLRFVVSCCVTFDASLIQHNTTSKLQLNNEKYL